MGNYKFYDDLSSSGKRKRKLKEKSNETHFPKSVVLNNAKFDSSEVPFSHQNFRNISVKVLHQNTSPIRSLQSAEDNQQSIGIREKLAKWAVQYQVKRNSLTSLLHILKTDKYPELPFDSRSLLKTPRNIKITEMAPGHFVYIGLEKILENLLTSLNEVPEVLFLDVNIDGSPIYNNSYENGVIWPILCRIKNLNSSVFPVAIYGGKKKPNDFNSIITPFVEELLHLEDMIMINGKSIHLKINNIICDAPARSAVCNIAGHMGT